MNSFFEELKRRKVYRVAVAYIVAGGGIIQLASAAFPAWELPTWTLRLVIVLLLAGFPIALILAWAFDVTPAGIKPADVVTSVRPKHRRRSIFLLLLVGLLVSVGTGFFLLPRAAAKKLDKSIAVLPFENFSDDKENAYFADGIQDDVLTSLSKVGDLKVISRTSVMSYRGGNRNVREIAKALGVGAVLEGSVRRIGNRVRLNVQLIDGATDEHLWAEDYDRDLTDVFAIQSELAHEIAGVLRAKLSPVEKAVMEHKPTENSEAYMLYMQAHAQGSGVDDTAEIRARAEQDLEKAIRLDPSFALAHALLSRLESYIYHEFEPVAGRIEKARSTAAEAIRLQPDLPEAHLALGQVYYYGDRDYERALEEFRIAWAGLPNDQDVYTSIAAIKRRQGKWDEAIANFAKAAALDPNNADALIELAMTYSAVRDFANAAKTIDRAANIAPGSVHVGLVRAEIALGWKGDIGAMERFFATGTPDAEGRFVSGRIFFAILQRNFSAALAGLQADPRKTYIGEGNVIVPKEFLAGFCFWAMKDETKAREAFAAALPFMESAVRDSPQSDAYRIVLGQAYAGLDRREDAVREGRRAVELLPESLDALNGPDALVGLAEIYGMLGDADAALPILEHSVHAKVGIPEYRLRLDPIWDRIRDDPRFQKLAGPANTPADSR